jgi:hypothetical protein
MKEEVEIFNLNKNSRLKYIEIKDENKKENEN